MDRRAGGRAEWRKGGRAEGGGRVERDGGISVGERRQRERGHGRDRGGRSE